MKKYKIPLLLVLTLGLLLAFACLPGIVASAVDRRAGKSPAYDPIRVVDMPAASVRQSRTFTQTVELLRNASVMDLRQEQADMTEEEVLEAVSAFMQSCEAAGVMEAFEPSFTNLAPKLLYDPQDPSRYLVVWAVTMINKQAPNQTLLLDLDDETGDILCISYDIYRSYQMDGVWEKNSILLEKFTQLYFAQFDVGEYWGPDVYGENMEPAASDAWEVDGGVTEAYYTFEDPQYGKMEVKFIVDGAGGIRMNFF